MQHYCKNKNIFEFASILGKVLRFKIKQGVFMIRYWLCLVLILHIHGLSAQEILTWKQLTDVKFKQQYSEAIGTTLMRPVFGEGLQALSGRDVQLTGYIIPLHTVNALYVLSKNPYASCYFCGGAGPETIVELWLQPNAVRRYKTDTRLTFRGVLHLNANDDMHSIYILKNATIAKQ